MGNGLSFWPNKWRTLVFTMCYRMPRADLRKICDFFSVRCVGGRESTGVTKWYGHGRLQPALELPTDAQSRAPFAIAGIVKIALTLDRRLHPGVVVELHTMEQLKR